MNNEQALQYLQLFHSPQYLSLVGEVRHVQPAVGELIHIRESAQNEVLHACFLCRLDCVLSAYEFVLANRVEVSDLNGIRIGEESKGGGQARSRGG